MNLRRVLSGTMISLLACVIIVSIGNMQRLAYYSPVITPTYLRSLGADNATVKARADDSVTFAWETSELLERSASRMLVRGSEFVVRSKSTVEFPAPGSCAYLVNSGIKLRSIDYSHRKRRPHEFSTIALFHAVKKEADSFFQFFGEIPTSVNHYPAQLSTKFNISEPFGGWASSFHEVHNRYSPLYRSPQKIDAQPPLFAATFQRAVVSHGHVATCSGAVFTAGGCLWDFHMPPIKSAADVISLEIAVALCDEWCKGYYHFTHEHLPRLALVHNLLVTNNHSRLVLSHAPTRFQLQFIVDVLGIPKDRIVSGVAVFGKTVVYPMPLRCGNTFTHMLYMLREIAFRRLNATRQSLHAQRWNFLFAERRKLSRMPINYATIKEKLVEEFAAIFSFETTFGEGDAVKQVHLFHSADVVLGPHGANIANTMWMRPKTHVLEMSSWRKGNMCYYTTSSRINVTHHLVLHDQGKDASYSLEYNYVRDHILHALQMLRRDLPL